MADAIDPSRYDAVTFDCYGTLIDWERGLLAFLQPLLERKDVHTIDDWTLAFFGEAEARLEAGPYRPYRDVLGGVLDAFGARLGFAPTDAERRAFVDSVGDWPTFADTVEALRSLSDRYRLAVVSNVDDALFARTRTKLEVAFADVITAEQVRAYKPDSKPFDEAERRLGVPRNRILHVAQSRFHDVAPARARGLDSVWIDRRGNRHGSGATKGSDAEPTFRFDDLKSLAAALR